MHFPLVWKVFRFLSHFLSRDSTIAHFVHTSPVTVSIQYKYLLTQVYSSLSYWLSSGEHGHCICKTWAWLYECYTAPTNGACNRRSRSKGSTGGNRGFTKTTAKQRGSIIPRDCSHNKRGPAHRLSRPKERWMGGYTSVGEKRYSLTLSFHSCGAGPKWTTETRSVATATTRTAWWSR